MTDEFTVIGRDERGHPHVRYTLDPREVTVIRDPQAGDAIIGYVWEPAGPVPSPIRTDPWANPRLIGREGIDVHEVGVEELRTCRRRWWRRA